MEKGRKVLKGVNVEVRFRKTRVMPKSIISEIINAIKSGMISGTISDIPHYPSFKASWYLQINLEDK